MPRSETSVVSTPERLHEAEIRPSELMAEQACRFAADVAWLVDRRDRFVHRPCPACDADESVPQWTKYELDYVRCGKCSTVYMDPRPEPQLLDEYYASSENYAYWNEVVFPASEDARRAKIFRPRAERVSDIARRHGSRMGTLVDVGAGFGTFCEEVTRSGAFERVIALEPEPNLAETCRRKGLDVIEAPVERAAFESVDVVTNFEVIEHLFSPREFVARCADILDPGGLLVVTCPNVKGFDLRVLGAASATIDVEHLNYMHPGSLASLLESEGFDVLESRTPGRLDAELVRKAALAGECDLSSQPFLDQVLLDEWERVGDLFQDFLVTAGLSSNMWLVGRRR
jgi:SAM-dependent methyltransferase